MTDTDLPAAVRIMQALADSLDLPGGRYYAATARDLARVLDTEAAAALLAAARRELAVPEIGCPSCGVTIRARLAGQPGATSEDVEQLRAENERLNRHLRVWHQGFQESVAGVAAAKRLLSNILDVVNRHQGANAAQAMEEIHEACMAALDAVPSPPASDGQPRPRVWLPCGCGRAQPCRHCPTESAATEGSAP